MEKRKIINPFKLMVFLFVSATMIFSSVSSTTHKVFAKDREIVEVNSGNSFNMRLSDTGVLTWDEVTGATGYKVVLLNSMGQSIWEWDNDFTNNSRVLPFIVEMDNRKYDSGRYVIEVIAKDANKTNSMSYYYTSNVDKLEEPRNLKWLGNQAAWEYVNGAIEYTVSLYDFEGLVARETVTECPVDLSKYNPQDGWTFTVQAETNGALNDKRDSNVAESPKKGSGIRTVIPALGNALNMKITETEVLRWDEVPGATGYQVVLKNPIGFEIYRWDNDLTNNARVLSVISEMDRLKVGTGHYRIEVEPKGAGSVAFIANYFYTSNVEQFEAPYNLKWNGSKATWTAVNGASSYDVTLYDFNGQVKTVTVTDDWYDFSEYNPQDGWTFKVQAEGDGKSTAKRASNGTESPAKTTSYNLTVVAYGTGNLTNTGKVSMETENDNKDFSTSVGGTYSKNTEVTVKAEANPGYEFVAWRVTTPENPEATLSTDATHTFKLENNLQLFAVFREIPSEYSVAYHGNGATGGMTGDTVDAGGTYILKNCTYYTPYGKKFAGWAIGSPDATPLKQPDEEITINADTTIYAVWEELYFTTQPTNTSGKIGTDIQLPVTIDLTQVPNEDAEYIVLEVKNGENWEKVAGSKKSDWVYSDGFTIQQNSACTKEYRYKIYNGTEWIESDTFTVEFLPIIVTFVDNTHSTITEPIEVDTVGGKISKPNDPTYPGDKFDGWWADGEWDFENRTVTQDIELSASWAGRGFYGDIPNVYAKLGEKARIDLSSVNNNGSYVYIYKYDGVEWKQDVAVSGYTWYDLSASDVEKTERYKIVINSNPVIESNEFTVTWTNDLPTYYVSYGVGEGQGSGGVDYDIEHGSNYTLDSYEDFGTIIAPEGKVFDYWSIRVGENAMDATEIAQKKAGETIVVTADTYAVAMWKPIPNVMISYYSMGNYIDGETIAIGSEYTLIDAQGLDVPLNKQFKAWAIGGVDGEQKQPGDKIIITEETYIIAVWEELPTFIVAYGPGDGNGSTDFEYIYPGTEITLQTPAELDFTAQENMEFSHWKVCKDNASDPNALIKQPGDKITITYETYIIAVWKAKAHECVGVIEIGQGATCTSAGWKDYYVCSCGKLYKDEACTQEITDLEAWKVGEGKLTKEHEYGELVERVPATHTQTELKEGMEAHYYCEECETYFDENKVSTTKQALVIAKPEHQYGPFITSDSEEHYKQCSCGLKSEVGDHIYTDEEDPECNICGHNRTVVHECEGVKQNGKPASCLEDGWKDYYKCSCNKIYSDEACTKEIIDLESWKVGEGKIEKGHSYGEWKTKTPADCENAEVEYRVCTTPNCGHEETRTGDAALGHKYGIWTSNGDGTHTRVCSLNQEHKETADCSGGSASCTEKAVCSLCNTAYGNLLAHSHGSTYKSDANEHWKECNCGDKADNAPHLDNNEDGKCDVCDYQLESLEPKGLSAGAIVGIVIGSVVIVGLGGFSIFWFVIKKKKFSDLLELFKKK